MTFTTIVATVQDRLNLTSSASATRIGEFVNERYRHLTASIGLITSRRETGTLVVNPTLVLVYPDLPEITILLMEKILKITLLSDGGVKVLPEKTFDDISNMNTNTALPQCWAVKLVEAHQVTIILDAVPLTTPFTLGIEGYAQADVLSGSVEPAFPESFHDILIHGAMADELKKMEKPQLAQLAENKFETRLSDLRMFIAKSAYVDIVQGINKPSSIWYRPWYTRSGGWN